MLNIEVREEPDLETADAESSAEKACNFWKKYSRKKTWRYTDAYRKGLNAKQAEYAVKKYRSHRSVGPSIIMSLGIMDNPS
ncbi:hypothetical protein K439DRAFT_401627 [Ramaria rubella]|nr:hypothetical protein K439DRAFT_401627 [Ramaria rubella]